MKHFNNTRIAYASKTKKDLQKAYWMFKFMEKPWLVKIGSVLAKIAFKLHLPVSGIFRETVFKHFCGGESIADCQLTIKELSYFKIGTILDYSIEGKERETDFKNCHDETIKTIELAKENPEAIPFCVIKITGIGRFDLLQKVAEKKELNFREKGEYALVLQRFEHICETAYKCDVQLFVDAEKSWIQDTVDQMTMSMMARFNKEKAIIFNTIQLYRHDRLDYLKKSFATAEKQGFYLGVKLVRGAYMEIERDRARKKGYPSPIQPDKEATDNDFNDAVRFCFERRDKLPFCLASHNELSTAILTDLIDEHDVANDHPNISFAQLYGMSDQISFNLAESDYNVAKYVPFGPVKDVMPYLIRRAEENTSVAGQTPRELTLIKFEIQRRNDKRDV